MVSKFGISFLKGPFFSCHVGFPECNCLKQRYKKEWSYIGKESLVYVQSMPPFSLQIQVPEVACLRLFPTFLLRVNEVFFELAELTGGVSRLLKRCQTYTFRWRGSPRSDHLLPGWTEIYPYPRGTRCFEQLFQCGFVQTSRWKFLEEFSHRNGSSCQHIWESKIQPNNDEPRKQKLIQGNYKVGKIHKSYFCSTSPEVMAFAMGPRRRWHRMRWKCGFHIRTPRM